MWELKNLTKELIPGAAELAREFYGEENDIAVPEYLEHEYYKNPAGDIRMKIAWDPEIEKVVGQQGSFPVRVTVNGNDKSALCSVNTITRATHYRQGIFKKLTEELYNEAEKDGVSFVFGMPNQRSYPGFLKHLDFKDIGAVPLYIRPIKPSGMVHGYLKNKFLEVCAHPFNGIFKVRPGENGVVLKDFRENAAGLADKLWAEVKGQYPVMVTKDYTYVKFRFIDIPRRPYEGYYAMSGDRVVGYAIGRVMDVSGLDSAMIADFIFVPGFEKEAAFMLNKLMERLTAKGATMAGCMVPPASCEAKILKKNKFFVCPKFMEPQPFRFIFRQLDKNDADAVTAGELKNWFFTMGDYDVV